MRVLTLVPSFDFGGGGFVLAIEVAKYLREQGAKVEIWSNHVDLSKTHEPAKYLDVKDVGGFIGRFALSVSSLEGLARILRFLYLRDELDKFDVVHCHSFPSNLAAIGAFKSRRPVVWQCNETPIALYPPKDQLAHHLMTLKAIGFYVMARNTKAFSLLRVVDRAAVKRISAIVVLSEMIRKKVKATYGRDATLLRFGADIDRFSPRVDGTKIRSHLKIDARPMILTVGLIGKRLDLLLRAMRIVAERIPDAVLVIAGLGLPSQFKALEDMVDKFGLASNVIIAAGVEHYTTLPFFYAASDVFVFTQPYWSWSLAVVEAMATGRPVIVPKNSGIAEIITDNVNGTSLDIMNIEQLASRICLLVANNRLRARIGENARLYVERNLNLKDYLKQYFQLIKATADQSEDVRDMLGPNG